MSEDPTKDIKQKYDTKPTIETVLERLNALEQTLATRFEQALTIHVDELTTRIDKLQEQINIRFDRIASEVKETHSELYTLRADFTELRRALGEHIPALKS